MSVVEPPRRERALIRRWATVRDALGGRVGLAIVVAALVVRVAVVAAQHVSIANDAADYQRIAVSIVHGHGFGRSPVAPADLHSAFRPPLYPYALAAVYAFTGVHLVVARLLGAVLGAVLVGLIIMVTRVLLDHLTALVAGGIATVYPALVIASTAPMSESVALPLDVACVGAAVTFRRTGRRRWLVCSGIAFGLAVLARPNIIVVALPLAVLCSSRPLSRRTFVAPAIALGTAFLVVTPWLVRDRVVLHRWVPLTTQTSYVPVGTYNATSYADPNLPAAWRPANADPAVVALLRHSTGDTEVALGDALARFARTFAVHHPTYVAKVAAYNSLRLIDLGGLAYDRAAMRSEFGYPGTYDIAEIAGFFTLLALAVLGLFSRRARGLPVGYWLVPAVLWLSMIPIEVLPRFRAAIDPFLIPLAATGAVLLWRTARSTPPRWQSRRSSAPDELRGS